MVHQLSATERSKARSFMSIWNNYKTNSSTEYTLSSLEAT